MIRVAVLYAVCLGLMFGLFYALGYKKEIKDVGIEGKKIECVSYAPFEKDQSPFDFDNGLKISESRIDKDLELLSKKTECVRTYSVTGLESIPKYAQKHNLKLLLGAWVNGDALSTQKELKKLIEMAKSNPEVIKAVVVGNETLLRREVSGEQLGRYIKSVKEQLPNTPVTYADVWEFWLKNPTVAEATDFITIHILPYWEDDPVPVSHSIEHIRAVRDEVKRNIPNKEILIGETGFPSFGRMREDVLPSPTNQALYIRSFLETAHKEGWRYNLIEAFDQPWKRISEGAVGGYWGLFDADRIDKGVLSGAVSDLPNWKPLFVVSVVLFLGTLLFFRKLALQSPKRLLLFFGVAMMGAFLFALQLNQFMHISRNIYEYIWAILVLGSMAGLYFGALFSIASNISFGHASILNSFDIVKSGLKREWVNGALFGVFIFSMLVSVVGLAFDGRYREFNLYVYGFGVALYFLFAKKSGNDAIERVSSVVFLIGAIWIFINETYLNIHSDIFVLITLLFAHLLWHGSKPLALSMFTRYIVVLVFSALFFGGVKYGILGADEYIAVCEMEPKRLICQIRSTLGMLIHLNLFGIIALALALASFLIDRCSLKSLALGFSVCALLLYNSSLGAIAFVLCWFAIVKSMEAAKVLE